MMLSTSLSRLSRYLPFEPLSLIRLLVLLLPIGAMYVEHWASGFFGLIILASLFLWPINRNSAPPLQREEKVLFSILAVYFMVALNSSIVNGWEDAGFKAMGNELKFILIIPFYLVIRRCEEFWRYLWVGSLIAVVVTTGFGLHELFVMNESRTGGAYGPLVLGPVLLLLVALQLPWHRTIAKYHWRNIVAIVIALAGLYIVFMSGARSAYLALIAGILIGFIYYFRARNSALVVTAAIIIVVLGYLQIDVAKHRIDAAVTDTGDYLAYMVEHPEGANKYGDGSIGTRLELWRASVFAATERPFLGIGRYNFREKLEQYAREGRINEAASVRGHAHSVYFEALASKGVPGLVVVLALFLYPLWFFVHTRHRSRESAFAGIVLIVLIAIVSLTEPGPVYRNNFTALFLVYLTTIFAWHSSRIRRSDPEQPVSAA